MLSKNKIKFINSLKHKDARETNNLFIAEGDKIVYELLLSDFTIELLAATQQWIDTNANYIKSRNINELFIVTPEELKKISTLSTPNRALAVSQIPQYTYSIEEIATSLSLALDTIQDPGNLGTIIRTAEWFGIKNIFCSLDCANLYNSKVVQASMGSLFRIKIHYIDLVQLLKQLSQINNYKIYGTILIGQNIYTTNLLSNGIIIIGNESYGISSIIQPYISIPLTIPPYSNKCQTNSLNAACATAIILSEFNRHKT